MALPITILEFGKTVDAPEMDNSEEDEALIRQTLEKILESPSFKLTELSICILAIV